MAKRGKNKNNQGWRKLKRKYTVYKLTAPPAAPMQRRRTYIGVTHLPLGERKLQHYTRAHTHKKQCPLDMAMRASPSLGEWGIRGVAQVTGDFNVAMALERKVKASMSASGSAHSLNQRTLKCA